MTSLPMDKEETKPAILVSCVMCLVLWLEVPGTTMHLPKWFTELAPYKCSMCGEMRALFERPSEGYSMNNYKGSDEEDHGSDSDPGLKIREFPKRYWKHVGVNQFIHLHE